MTHKDLCNSPLFATNKKGMPHQTSSFPIITRWVNHDKDKHIHPTKDDYDRKKEWWVRVKVSKITKSIWRRSFVGVRIVSVIFYRCKQVISITDGLFFASSPSSLSAASKTSSLSSSMSNIKKRLVLDSPDNQNQAKKKAHCNEPLKKQEPKFAVYEADWFNSTSTKYKCLKHTSDKNLPVTQEWATNFHS